MCIDAHVDAYVFTRTPSEPFSNGLGLGMESREPQPRYPSLEMVSNWKNGDSVLTVLYIQVCEQDHATAVAKPSYVQYCKHDLDEQIPYSTMLIGYWLLILSALVCMFMCHIRPAMCCAWCQSCGSRIQWLTIFCVSREWKKNIPRDQASRIDTRPSAMPAWWLDC